jgi:peptide subunit release factor 1 (eRF1)
MLSVPKKRKAGGQVAHRLAAHSIPSTNAFT